MEFPGLNDDQPSLMAQPIQEAEEKKEETNAGGKKGKR